MPKMTPDQKIAKAKSLLRDPSHAEETLAKLRAMLPRMHQALEFNGKCECFRCALARDIVALLLEVPHV
jgi:hypothetical protein